jgi:hypothetical protein
MTESREQSTADLRSARYDIITAGENWATVVTGGLAAGPYRLTQERGIKPLSSSVMPALPDGALDPTPVDTHIPQQQVIKLCQLSSGLSDAPFPAQIGPEPAYDLPTFLDEIGPDRKGDVSIAAIPRVAKFDGTDDRSG